MNTLPFDSAAETENCIWTVFHCDMEFTFNTVEHALAYANGVESTGQMIKKVDPCSRQIRLVEAGELFQTEKRCLEKLDTLEGLKECAA